MECSRCGGEAVVKRDNAVYCGKCALARDWQEIIHVVQQDRVTLSSKPAAQAPASKPESSPPADPVVAEESESAAADSAPASPPKEVAQEAPAADAAKADPFA